MTARRIGATGVMLCGLLFGFQPPNLYGGERSQLDDLDGDQNGLYDDAERRALLDVLQSLCPTLPGGYDTDGDGAVTPREQTAGRHPLSQLIPWPRLMNGPRIPWAIDIFPEWIMTAYLQEDAADGPVRQLTVRGTVQATGVQGTPSLQPVYAGGGRGIGFAANSGQHLLLPGQRDARWNYRWCILTFRIDAQTGAGDETVLVDINRGGGSSRSSPKIWYSKRDGLSIQYVGTGTDGLDRRVMTSTRVVADGSTWNVVVGGVRQGRMFASVNGYPLATEHEQPDRFAGVRAPKADSFLGDPRDDTMAWSLDALVFGLTEPSEAMVRKMTGWAAHRLKISSNLPEGHPYRTERPVLDAEDFPHRYVHDNEQWVGWGASLTPEATRVNAGGPRAEPQGFERVFYDDFRAYRVSASTSGEGDLWMAPGFNTAVGMAAPLNAPGQDPDVYPHDAATRKQTLALAKGTAGWRGSAIYSVNDMGQGYTWAGPKIFRVRCMFPEVAQEDLARGLFPAFWSYGTEFLFWRTANRIEVDWFEFEGKNGRWYNGLSTHYHYPHVKNEFVQSNKSYPRYKVYGGELTEEKSGIPGGVYVWDGAYHTWEFVVDTDTTYVNVTVPGDDGADRWVEVCRCPTAPTYLERLDLQLDYALKDSGAPASERQDFVVDWVEVLQKTEQIQSWGPPFTARPRILGDAVAGGTVTCQANLEGISDIRYYWFVDGYPVTYGSGNAYPVAASDRGKAVQCMVKAVGARNMPEAWSEPKRVR